MAAIGFFPTNPNVARSVAAYNQGLSAEAIARMQEAAAITQAQLQAQAQRDALQANAQQNAFANSLRQQELQNQSAYQRGQLENQRAATQAQLEWNKSLTQSQGTQAGLDRENRLEIAKLGANRYSANPIDIQEMNNRTQAMAGRLNFALKSLKEAQAADEKKVADTFTQDMAGFSPFTSNSAFAAKRDKALGEVQNRYRTQIQQILQSVPEDAALDFDQTRMMFVPKMIGTPGASVAPAPVPVAPGAPAAPPANDILREAQDAIAQGANPAAVQKRLQEMGLVLPPMGGLPPAESLPMAPQTWPPVSGQAMPPAAVVPARPGVVMPIPQDAPPFGYFRQ